MESFRSKSLEALEITVLCYLDPQIGTVKHIANDYTIKFTASGFYREKPISQIPSSIFIIYGKSITKQVAYKVEEKLKNKIKSSN
jgi:hypothetical protein